MRKLLQAFIIIVAVVLIILVWPVEIIRNVEEHHNGGEIPVDIVLSSDSTVEQEFVPQYPYLKGMKIYLGGEGQYNFTVDILDKNDRVIFEKNCFFPGGDSFYEVKVSKRLKKNNEYRIKLLFDSSDESVQPIIKVSDNPDSLSENREFSIQGAKSDKVAITMYIYGVSQHWLSYLIYDSFIIMMALCFTKFLRDRG